jgi:tRNA (guanine37-N1)-methyltransferase
MESGSEESFEDGLLEYPQYTRPRDWEGLSIPDPLLSGDHARIKRWRKEEALRLTRERRPDLLKPRESR